jgi:ribosomal subunit interface protein
MDVQVTARHFQASTDLRELARETAAKFSRYNDHIHRVEIVMSKENTNENSSAVEFIVHVQDQTVVITERAPEFEKALHDGSERVIRQFRKLRTKAERNLHQKV